MIFTKVGAGGIGFDWAKAFYDRHRVVQRMGVLVLVFASNSKHP